MSANDGKHPACDDGFRYQQDLIHTQQLLQQQQQQQPQQQQHIVDAGISQRPGHQFIWPHKHPAMMAPQPRQHFVHQTPQPHLGAAGAPPPPPPTGPHIVTAPQHQTHQHQQTHHYNEFMFNMHAPQAYVQPAGQPETYSVLPVGHGNFLKIYHCNDALSAATGGNGPEITTGGIYAHQTATQSTTMAHAQPQQQQQQQQQQTQQQQLAAHMQHQHYQGATPQHFSMAAARHPATLLQINQQPAQPQHQSQQQQFTQTGTTLTQTQTATPQTTQPTALPQIFNRYELFSSNPLLPAACDTKLSVLPPQQQQQQQQIIQEATQNNVQNVINNNEETATAITTTTTAGAVAENEMNDGNSVAVTTTNMIINKLVNNWSPNLTGVAYTQFIAPTPPPITNEMAVELNRNDAVYIDNVQQIQQPQQQSPLKQQSPQFNQTTEIPIVQEQPQQQQIKQDNIETENITAQHYLEQKTLLTTTKTTTAKDLNTATAKTASIQPMIATTNTNLAKRQSADATKETTTLITTATTKTNNINSNNKGNIIMPEVKKRIVAEVKPMRMTYSDVVLSKVTFAQQQLEQEQQQQSGILRNSNKPMGTATQMLNSEQRNQKNNQNISGSTTTTTTPPISTTVTSNIIGANNKRTNFVSDEGRTNKKSPTHEQKDMLITNAATTTTTTIPAVAVATVAGNNKTNNKRNNNVQIKMTVSKTINNVKTQTINDLNSNLNNKKRNNINNNNSTANVNTIKDANINLNKKVANTTATTTTTNTANNNNNNNNNTNNSANGYLENERITRKNCTTTKTNNIQNNNNNNVSSQGSTTTSYTKTRYSTTNNLNNSSSYSYSTKRQRSSYNNNNTNIGTYYGSPTSSSSSSSSYATSNRNYELAQKLLRTWCEYMLKVLTWLFYLVYDIVVIGCSMAYDSLQQNALSAWTQLRQLRAELQQNSNKPSMWLRTFCRRLDARFSKNSRWAFWRRFYTKKPPPVTTQETFRSGRLPQTGDEAMYSLLNCKGKNAYSILGVPPDSSQEQIRKHYKKIAVLVHPDKNKQAGAEEAFKVLQRAFELIGEPENRHAYDQSLAESLHAEKAWTEFHDLLSQLHTKITEAANTIRCSTCSLRHPRKLTERPHYAARECASCKIRHSAREGDIWAESSMLGLRWKYLALMEGKVYDITEWANCQKGALSHLEPNSHMVQYRIVRGAQQQQQQQQQHQQQQQQQQTNNPRQQRQQSPGFDNGGVGGFATGTGAFGGAAQYANDMPTSEASLHEFLDNVYSGQNPLQQSSGYSNSSRRRSRRN